MLKKIKKIIFYVLIYFLLTSNVEAASLSISPLSSNVSVGGIVSVSVIVNTDSKYINNSEASIQFPSDLLEVISISKKSSIFNLWVEEPTFSNISGKILFNGGAPNPGYMGMSGNILNITFKAKKAGSASIIIDDAAVRANDGMGTDILNNKISGIINITTPKLVDTNVYSTEKNTLLAKPSISSNSHPDINLWYKNDIANFSWQVPSNALSVEALFNNLPNSVPNIKYDNSVTQKTINNISDGVHYFHLRFTNSSGSSAITHYKINVDNKAPEYVKISNREDGDLNYLKIDSKDLTSGIDYFILNIDNLPQIQIPNSDLKSGEYLLPYMNGGSHTIWVKAYDKAGNYTESEKLLFSTPDIKSPTVSIGSSSIISGDSVVVSGVTSYPNSNIIVVLEMEGREIKRYQQKTGSSGEYSITTDKLKNTGTVSIWSQMVLSDYAKSLPSEKIFLNVEEVKVIRVTLSIFYPLIVISIIIATLLFIIFMIYLGWHKFFNLRNQIKEELTGVTKEVHKASLLLKDELNSQLDVLEKVKIDRRLNKKEKLIFNELKKNVDNIEEFIENKLNKLM